MKTYIEWAMDYTRKNPLRAAAIAFVKGLVVAALLIGCSSSCSAQDVSVSNIDLEAGTFDLGVSVTDTVSTVTSVTLWISEPDWDITEVVLNDEEVLPFLDTHTISNFELGQGATLTLPLPLSWLNWLDHGIFSAQDNVAVIGVWTMNDFIPWIYGADSDYPETNDEFADSYDFVQAVPTQNLVEVPSETVYVYVDSTTGIDVATVTVPTVMNTSEELTLSFSGQMESFSFVIYNTAGAVVWTTSNPNDFYSHNQPTGVYLYSLQVVIGGETYTEFDSIYFN
tara:strand:- start:667 stop:1512 length:846 start_codon:yes stop_codon:yes gene_type:complete